MYKKYLTKEQAIQKLKHFCGYQERCHLEVREKLYDLGVSNTLHDEIVSTLIEENYLNEERFAVAFVGGKFRVKQWGRVKIKHELKQKQISEYNIRKAMKEIDEQDYYNTLRKLYEEKWNSLKGEKNRFIKLSKTRNYLLQKGFESDAVKEVAGAGGD